MSKPKFKYQIGQETPLGQRRYDTGSWPEFKDLVGEALDNLSDEDNQESTIIIKKVKND